LDAEGDDKEANDTKEKKPLFASQIGINLENVINMSSLHSIEP
jgi:hypothetical protein